MVNSRTLLTLRTDTKTLKLKHDTKTSRAASLAGEVGVSGDGFDNG